MNIASKSHNKSSLSKRRPALNVSSKHIRDYQDESIQNKFKKLPHYSKQNQLHVEFFAKFQESAIKQIPSSAQKNHNLFRTQKKFEKILRNIEPRGGNFYRFGFKSFEKGNKKLLADVLNVTPSRMKGTMHVGELWSTVQTTKYLRQNRIYMNKIKLIDKLKQAKEQQEKEMIQSTATLLPPPADTFTRNSLNSRICLTQPNNVSQFQNTETNNESFRELNRSIEQINKQLRSLKPFNSTEKNSEKLKHMQDCIERIEQIDSHYHAQLAEWI